MGIDIYAKWRGQSKTEEQAQYTGYATDAGKVGYLREAYHGSPYVTKFLLKEAFDSKGSAKIPAHILRERLPATVLLSLFREKNVYGAEAPEVGKYNIEHDGDMTALVEGLKNVFNNEMTDNSHEEIAKAFDEESLKSGQRLIDLGTLPVATQSFVDFVVLCEKKEKELGEPCEIIASY